MSKEIVVKFEIGDNLKRLMSHMTIAMQKSPADAGNYRDVMIALVKNLEFADTPEFTKEFKDLLRSLDI
jgi:hypothetical protein